MVVRVVAGLVKRLSRIAQRAVHVDFHLTILSGIRPLQLHATGKILWSFRAGVDVVPKLQQADGEGVVVSTRAQFEFISMIVVSERLRFLDVFRYQPGAQ